MAGPAMISVLKHTKPIPALFFGGGDETLDDGSKYNPVVISFLRDAWIQEQVQAREAEFTEYRGLRCFVGTWNVNGKFPKEDLTPWLCEGVDADAERRMTLPDIYVIGLQEMVDLTVTNVALGGQSGKRSEQWLATLTHHLNTASGSEDDRYELVGSRYLVGVMLAVYVRAKHAPFVTAMQTAEAPVGVMGLMGNKGGVSLRLALYDSTFCFVCAHLAAHRNAVAQRNADFASIMAKTEFVDEARAEAYAAAVAAGAGSSGGGAGGAGAGAGAGGAGGGGGGGLGMSDPGHLSILDHDFVVWFGDFNYRIVETVATERCFELAEGGDAELEQLRRCDQLNIERAAQRSFHGFLEGPLTFRPTYKFEPGTKRYEQRPEKKLRAPAWCDRILWRTAPGIDAKHFRQLFYGSVDELVTSDHKPVHAIFDTAAKTIIRERKAAVVADITRQLDAMENRALPKVDVSHTVVHMHDVVYAIPSVTTITLDNTGEVAAAWRFVPKPEERWYCKTWLTIDPPYGLLAPGERATLTLTVTVDDAVARDISLGRELSMLPTSGSGTAAAAAAGGVLEDILILRMERGRDYFVAVSATVLPTAFGCSLAQLSRRPEPMRALALTAAATRELNRLNEVALGVSPTVTATSGTAGAAGAAVGAGVGPREPPNPSAGSHSLAHMLASDESDIAWTAGSPSIAAPLTLPSSDATKRGSALMGVPKEIWRLVDALVTSGLKTRGIFVAPGDAADMIELRECLDTGEAFPTTVDSLALAQVLIDLLESLREPVIHLHLFPGAEYKAMPIEAWVTSMLQKLWPLHYNVLIYLVRFGREVLAHAADNGLTVDDLAFVFSRCMMRRYQHDEAPAFAPYPGDDAGGSGGAAAAAGGGKGGAAGGGDEDEGAGSAVTKLSLYADKGTRWEPTREEQDQMTRIFALLLTTAPLSISTTT